jgi:hypothetical protein
MHFDFVVDRMIQGRAYPALTLWSAEPYTLAWREFGQHWPFTVPVNLYDHCAEHNVSHAFHTIDQFPTGAYYAIALLFFDHSIDYFALISDKVLECVQRQQLKILFYYDEGDNPAGIKQRLDHLCHLHSLSVDCYKFISANSACDNDQFVYMPCDELLYWQRNQTTPAASIHTNKRTKEFTVLSRTHKWWRATAMTDLKRQGILDRSYWSYNSTVGLDETPESNALDLVAKILHANLEDFMSHAPYSCDSLSADQHNDHTITNTEHFVNSYASIVLETHFDADNSDGAFLTEKTFKAIKHGHPFVIVGCVGSLDLLRRLGYRVFDHVIDNSYDLERDNVQRWIKIVRAIQQIQQHNMHDWFLQCIEDVRHNQQIFLRSKQNRLQQLYRKLND